MGKNKIGKCQVRAPLVPVLVITGIEWISIFQHSMQWCYIDSTADMHKHQMLVKCIS